jgi:hypothetical protein
MSALHQYYGALSSGTLILRGFVVWYINITGLCRLVHQYYGALSSGISILRGFVVWFSFLLVEQSMFNFGVVV